MQIQKKEKRIWRNIPCLNYSEKFRCFHSRKTPKVGRVVRENDSGMVFLMPNSSNGKKNANILFILPFSQLFLHSLPCSLIDCGFTGIWFVWPSLGSSSLHLHWLPMGWRRGRIRVVRSAAAPAEPFPGARPGMDRIWCRGRRWYSSHQPSEYFASSKTAAFANSAAPSASPCAPSFASSFVTAWQTSFCWRRRTFDSSSSRAGYRRDLPIRSRSSFLLNNI